MSCPPFMNWLIDNALLPLLLLAEGYLMGSLFSRGWVDNIETPNHWGTYHGIGVVVFYGAGAVTAGLGLRASVAYAASLHRHKWGFAFLNLLTVVGLSLSEMWASFSERSFHLITSPADGAVLHFLGFPANAAISPTLLVASIVLPFTTLTYGFSQQGKARTSKADLADDETQWDRKILKAEKMAQLRKVQAGGARGAINAMRGKEEEEPAGKVPLASLNGSKKR